MKNLFRFAATALLLTTALAQSPQRVAPQQPPDNRIEAKPNIPADSIWEYGYWFWGSDKKFHWSPGKLVKKPNAQAKWADYRWEKNGTGGWNFIYGFWHY